MRISKKIIEIIGVPMDLGANIRGSAMGPEAIRLAGLKKKIKQLNLEYFDSGNINVPIRETIALNDQKNKFLNIIRAVNDSLSQKVEKSLKNNHFPLILGGDHSLAIGSVIGTSKYLKNPGLIWIDTHADINTPQTSPTQNIHGMPLSILLGDGHTQLTSLVNGNPINPKHICIIGLRSIDGHEVNLLKKSGVSYFTMRDIDEKGISKIMHKILSKELKNCDGIHVSLDLDVLDPQHAPGVSTPVSGGLSLREAHLILELIADSDLLTTLDMVELNPYHDIRGKTAINAIELILSALGKAIV